MNTTTRRDSLKVSALAGSAMILPGLAMGKKKSANGKLNVAMIGSGGISKTCFRECEEENLIAIAEVDTVRGADGLTRFPDAKHYTDFRKMLDNHGKELDAVIVNTPDHTHFAATFAAMERGIHVHTQKPLTHNIWQARTLQAAAKKFKVQTVMGNQGHNMEGMRMIKDWYDAGLAGKVKEVHAWTNRSTPNNFNGTQNFGAQPVPDTLDWDLWQGPVAPREYNKTFVPAGWRWHWDYGMGGLGDIGCHTLDIPKYAMGLNYPKAVYMDNSLNFRHEFDDQKPKRGAGTYVYEFDGVTVYWYEGGHMPHFTEELKANHKIQNEGGCLLVGDKNTIYSPGMRPSSPRLEKDWEHWRRGNLPPKVTPRAPGNPVKELFMAIKGEIPRCSSSFEDYAVELTEIVQLGTIANRSGKRVEYNPKTMTFKDKSLNHYVKESVRKGWAYGEGLV